MSTKSKSSKGKNVKKAEAVDKPKPTFKPMKKGDYSVHILVEEVRNLTSKEDANPNPIIKITTNNVSKRTKSVNEEVSTYFYGEHIYFDCLDMNYALLDSAKIVFEVYDKNFSDRKDYIGIHEFDFSFIYNSEEHAIHNYWIALANPESDDFSKIRGYLKLSCSILHTDDKRVELLCSQNEGKDGMIALPPQIKAVYFQVDIQIFYALGVPDMDAIFSVNKNKKECNGYIVMKYMGTEVKTSVKDMVGNVIYWNEMISLPVSSPVVTQKICCSLYDHDTVDSDDIIGSFEIEVNDILNGFYSNFRFINIYGAPLKVSGEMTDSMNENSEIGSLWKGKILINANHKKTENPKTKLSEILKNSPVLVEVGKLREKTLWNFEFYVESAMFLPWDKEDYMVKIMLEEQAAEFSSKKSENGMITWDYKRNISMYAMSDNIDDLGEIFVYLIYGKKDEEKNRVCFQRLNCRFFLDNDEFFILKFLPDPAIGKVSKVSQSGLLKLKCKMTCPGGNLKKYTFENIEEKVKEGINAGEKFAINIVEEANDEINEKTNLTTKPSKKEESDSSDDDLDAMIKKKADKSLKLKEIAKKKDIESNRVSISKKFENKKTIIVNVHQTRALIPGDDSGLSDPYVIVKFLSQSKKTTVKYNSTNGIWNETLIFSGLAFDIDDISSWPVAYIDVKDKDTFSEDDDLGYTYVWISDSAYKVNDLSILEPKWVDLFLPISNKKQGRILLSFYIIDETQRDLVSQIPNLNIIPANELYSFEINILGLRGLQPKGIFPVKKAFIKFDLNSISCINQKEKLK